jgi:hypothetical protein
MFKGKSLILLTGAIVITALALAASTFTPPNILKLTASSDRPVRQASDAVVISNDNPANVNAGAVQLPADKATTCNGQWQGNARYALNSWFTGQEYYAVYQDPTETGCPPAITYPFEVDNVIWHVFNPNATPFDVNIQPLIYTVDLTDPLCPKPGVVCCYGPLYTVTIPVGTGGAIVTLPLDSGCCVYGPYFAGVWAPDLIGTGLVGIVVDSVGFPGTFGSRVCANYNNYQGLWEDLIVAYGFPGNVRLWSDGTASDENACDPCAQIIEPGVDLWTTPPGSTFDNHFSDVPIPAGFFDPGSEPFTGIINFQGAPLTTDPLGALGSTDAVVLRRDRAAMLLDGPPETVPIEIVALNLVSIQPITVTYQSSPPELWDVRVTLSSQQPQQLGQMTITKDCCNGGTFTSTLPVTPKFIFTRIGGPDVRVLDLGGMMPPIQFQSLNGHWSYDIPAPFDLVTCPGMVAHDHDQFPGTPDILIPPSAKFTPGFRTLPCDPQSPNDPFCGGKVLTLEQEQLAQHGVLPPQRTTPVEGACCLPDGSCIITTPDCCVQEGGEYQGDFTMCFPDPCSPPVDTVYDTLCTIADIVVTPNPTDDACLNPVDPISLVEIPGMHTIVRRSPDTPYVPAQVIETEMISMSLTGNSPQLGPVILRAGRMHGLPPSMGQVHVLTTNPSGELTNGDSFFDVFVRVELPGLNLINQVPIRMEASLPALPPPAGVVYLISPSQPPVQLFNESNMAPMGYLCFARHSIILCTCCVGIRGDANGDGAFNPNILDLNFLVNYIFRLSGNPGPCLDESNANGDGAVNPNILDLNLIVNYIFRFGPPPGPCPLF